jgi:hypothetical protein
VGQVDLLRSFGTEDYQTIWAVLNTHLNVHSIRTSSTSVTYTYNWTELDYAEQQIEKIKQGT